MQSEYEDKKLPRKIIPFSNPDKGWHETWHPDRDLLDFPHPFRCNLTGPPNSGKSTTVLNIIIRCRPWFEKIIVIYPGGGEGTSEYESLGDGVVYLDSIPAPSYFPPVKSGAEKTIVIIDDFELKELNKAARSNLDRLIGHVSTHRSVSVLLCAQEYFNVPTVARRNSNLHIFWRPKDRNQIPLMSTRMGEDMDMLFELCKTPKDSIWIDQTVNSPAPLRLNGYEIIDHIASESDHIDSESD